MYTKFLKSIFSHRFWLLTAVLLSGLLVTSAVYATPNRESNAEGHYYYVRKGDTLSKIAQSYSVSVEELVYFNSLKNPDLIHVGDPLYIPTSSDRSTCDQHTVTAGQTLSGIAVHYNVSLQKLVEINDIYDVDHITSGMKICIPQNDKASTVDPGGISDDTLGTLSLRKGQATDRVYKISRFQTHVHLDSSTSGIEIDDTVQFVLLGDILLARYSFWFGHSYGEDDLIGPPNLGGCYEVDRTWEIAEEPIMTRIEGIPGIVSSEQKPINQVCLFRSAIDLPMLETAIQHELGTGMWQNLTERTANNIYELLPLSNYIISENVNEGYSLHTFSLFTDVPEPSIEIRPPPALSDAGSAGVSGRIATCKAKGCDPKACSSWSCWFSKCCYLR